MARYVDIECDSVTEVIDRRAFKSRNDIQDFLDNIPTADVQEVKHGNWIKAGVGITERVICSNCKSSKGSYMKPPFCSQCGAKMDIKQGK